jgi:uncharacterized protein YjbI with pentapeptide repeats
MKTPLEVSDLAYGHLLTPHEGELETEAFYETELFDGFDAEGDDAGEARFSECAFRSASLADVRLRRCRFSDVWFGGCRVVGSDLAHTGWLDVTMTSTVLAGVEAFDAELRRMVFHGAKLNSVNLRGARMREVVFENCVLDDVDFTGASLTDVRFPDSALRGVRIARSTLKKVDLRGATALEFADGYDALNGAIIDSVQLVTMAPLLAQALGITVRD